MSVQGRFVQTLNRLYSEDLIASALRQQELAATSHHWAPFKSTSLCMNCLKRPPERILDCGHGLCESCIPSLSSPWTGIEYGFRMSQCTFCLSKIEFFTRIPPPTITPIILALDGGGIKGVIETVFLKAIQMALGPVIPLQDYFDGVFGTSIGGLILLDIFSLRTELSDCQRRFEYLASEIFPSRVKSGFSICSIVREIFSRWFLDRRHDPFILESILKQTFGTQRRLFDVCHPESAGIKLGITATTAADARLCLFTNYNGQRERRSDSGEAFYLSSAETC
jgi:Patatin-like phospholipase